MNSCDKFMKTMHNFVRILSFDFLDDFNVPIQNLWVNNWTPLLKNFPLTTLSLNSDSSVVNYGPLEFTQIPFYSFFLPSEVLAQTSIQHIPMHDVNI
jgi:hypothetical protein